MSLSFVISNTLLVRRYGKFRRHLKFSCAIMCGMAFSSLLCKIASTSSNWRATQTFSCVRSTFFCLIVLFVVRSSYQRAHHSWVTILAILHAYILRLRWAGTCQIIWFRYMWNVPARSKACTILLVREKWCTKQLLDYMKEPNFGTNYESYSGEVPQLYWPSLRSQDTSISCQPLRAARIN